MCQCVVGKIELTIWRSNNAKEQEKNTKKKNVLYKGFLGSARSKTMRYKGKKKEPREVSFRAQWVGFQAPATAKEQKHTSKTSMFC